MGLSQILLKDSRYSFKFHFVPLKYLLSRILLRGFVQAHENEYSYRLCSWGMQPPTTPNILVAGPREAQY